MIEKNQKSTFKKIQATQICNVKLERYFNFQSGSRGGLDHNLTILFTTHYASMGLVYLPEFTIKKQPIVDKYTSLI